jgi:hypothetical protein
MNELYEVEISALLDNELSHADILELVDHLVASDECRPFYQQARELSQTMSLSDLPPDMWERIEKRASEGRQRRFPRWPLKLVAVVVCAVGIWSIGRYVPREARLDNPSVTIQLASDSGQMNEDRFIELTTELLRADRRYHSKMGEIMNAVNASASHEGSAEGRQPLSDDQKFLRALDTELDERREPLWD